MNIRQVFIASGFIVCSLAAFARADEGRYVQENGITYYDTFRVVQRPVTETSLQQTTRTVYKEQVSTETRDVTRTYWCPVTTYRAETEMVGKWNFFVEPYWETHWVAETQWVPHSETVKMPVTCRKLVPETQTVQVPVTNQKVVCEKVLVSRVMVSNPAAVSPTVNGPVARPTPQSTAAPTTSQLFYQPPPADAQIGGVARLSQDPPRYSTSPATPAATP